MQESIIRLVLTGLILPALVLTGLYIGLLVGRSAGRPWTFIATLAGTGAGLLIGSATIWLLALRAYRKRVKARRKASQSI